ncbi:phage late control D family protein, partial [Methylosinus sp. Sm6]|uniref:phage late control D family protein n=1 Tax=Methylosinus sp. Sm6 TaxID=2866948 RepID=UPI001C990368
VTDGAGEESDGAEISCVGPPSRFGLPGKGAKYTILGGWADEGPVLQGVYTVQTITLRGSPEEGDRIAIKLRAADYIDRLKAHGSRHYDEGSFGELVGKVAKEAGLEAAVSPEIGAIKLPYQLRWSQSPIDFLRDIGRRYGAVVKPAGGKLIVLKRGSGQSASGLALEPIVIKRRGGFGYEIETEPRPEVGHVAAAWHDGKSGRRKLVKRSTGRDGPIFVTPHLFSSEAEAQAAADAEAYERSNNSGSGHFDSPGLPRARAEAPVIVSGYGWPIDGQWKAETLTKRWTAQGGFETTVNVKAGQERKDKQT